MNREIKFRAWDELFKVMLYDGFHIAAVGHAWGWVDTACKTSAIIEMPIMQFTGLKDKNGKEIYEGDIVSQEVETEYGKEVLKEEITYDGGAFYPVCMQVPETFEVIGNIYENPELKTDE